MKLALIVMGGLLVMGGCARGPKGNCHCMKTSCTHEGGAAGIKILKKGDAQKSAGNAGIVIKRKK
ncbi:MAG: hypothetical protein JW812_00465 [Alphaproteobacteria bacterium]|nr:hypothetical protein [Alphaproteobacteria bacterium]MBN2780101.1 hypothetical protein [Alphaproteobacteria bacterium]